MIANFAPSSATGSRYYCEVNSVKSLQAASEEIKDLPYNTTRENSAVVKLIADIVFTNTGAVFSNDAVYDIMDAMSEDEQEELYANPQPLAFVTLDLNGHVLALMEKSAIGAAIWTDLEIIDSNPTAENTLPDGTTVTGGAVYGDGGSYVQAFYSGFITISGGNFYGDMALLVLDGVATINQGVFNCYLDQFEGYEFDPSSIIIMPQSEEFKSQVYINGGQIDYAVVAPDYENMVFSTNAEFLAQYVTVDESKVTVKKDSCGNIIGYAEKVNEPEPTPTPEDPENPEDPNEQDPVENPTEQKPSDNKTPVISGTTDNGQPTSDDFMQIMMIGILVIVALSVISIAASLLIIKKYRPRVA